MGPHVYCGAVTNNGLPAPPLGLSWPRAAKPCSGRRAVLASNQDRVGWYALSSAGPVVKAWDPVSAMLLLNWMCSAEDGWGTPAHSGGPRPYI